MSITLTIPANSRPILTANIFQAAFNAPTVNRYDFGVPANENQLALPLRGNSIYIIERLNFSMDVPEGNFQEGIESIPLIQLKKRSTNHQVFPDKIPFINYVDNLEMLYFIESTKPDELLITMTGVLTQPAALVGDNIIQCFFQMNIYEVKSTEWNQNFWRPHAKLGESLSMRGRGGGRNY